MEIGWWLAPVLGKGLATKAARAVMLYGFEDLNYQVVRVCTFQNQIRVMEKLGMHFEKMSTDHRMRLCIMQRTS